MDEIVRRLLPAIPTDPTLDEAIETLEHSPNEVFIIGGRVVLMSVELYEKLKAPSLK